MTRCRDSSNVVARRATSLQAGVMTGAPATQATSTPVLHLTRDLPPASQGGVSIAVASLRVAMGRVGVAQAVVSFDAWRPIKAGAALPAPAPVQDESDAVGPIWRLSRPEQLAAAQVAAGDWLLAHPQAIVLCHADLLFPVAEQLAQACRAAGAVAPRLALVAHVLQRAQRLIHGLDAPTASEQAQLQALWSAQLVIAPSLWAERVLRGLAADAEIRVAPPPPVPTGPAAQATTTADARQHLVYLGRFDAIKGFDVLLAALPGLLLAVPSLRVTLAGGLPMAQKGEARWRKRIDAALASVADWSSRVELPGFLDHARGQALLATADVVVVPSRLETYGQVAAEAMALGRCVVAADGGALGERLRDGVDALVVAAGDADALTTALLRALDDPALRHRLGAAAALAEAQRPRPIEAWLRALSSAEPAAL